jgi:hypothetical protein
MRRCKYCGLMPEFRETEATTANIKLFIWECPKQCHYISSELSKTNARKLWDKYNIVTRQDMYDSIIQILGDYYDNEILENVRTTVLDYESKIYEINN